MCIYVSFNTSNYNICPIWCDVLQVGNPLYLWFKLKYLVYYIHCSLLVYYLLNYVTVWDWAYRGG